MSIRTIFLTSLLSATMLAETELDPQSLNKTSGFSVDSIVSPNHDDHYTAYLSKSGGLRWIDGETLSIHFINNKNTYLEAKEAVSAQWGKKLSEREIQVVSYERGSPYCFETVSRSTQQWSDVPENIYNRTLSASEARSKTVDLIFYNAPH